MWQCYLLECNIGLNFNLSNEKNGGIKKTNFERKISRSVDTYEGTEKDLD